MSFYERRDMLSDTIEVVDSETNKVVDRFPHPILYTTDQVKRELAMVDEFVLSNRDNYKQRGLAVVKNGTAEVWSKLVDNSLNDKDRIHYNGAIIEAALQCMEKLSAGESVEEAYKPIDVQDENNPVEYFGIELTGIQNYSVTTIIGQYHERGCEFVKYRNKFVNNPVRGMSK